MSMVFNDNSLSRRSRRANDVKECYQQTSIFFVNIIKTDIDVLHPTVFTVIDSS